MTIDIRGLADHPALRQHVTRRMRAELERLVVEPTLARVSFFDDNGPKGGLGARCALLVRLPRQPEIRVEHVAETPRLAFDMAAAVLERQVDRHADRRRESRRRPKKYFVAKRLLARTGGRAPRRAARARRTP